MEYDYSREFNQKHKIYTLPNGKAIPYAKDGIKLSSIVMFCTIVFIFIIMAIIAFVKKITFLQSLFTNAYLLILFFIGVLVWFLFSLKYDNKNFFSFLSGRLKFLKTQKLQVEHGHKTVFYKEQVMYQRKKGRRR